MSIIDQRPHYSEIIATTDNGEKARFTDPFNKWLDDLAELVSPEPDGVSAYLTSTQATTAATPAVLTGWTEVWDDGGDFDATTGIYTAARDNKRRISGQVGFTVTADGDRLRVTIKRSVGTDILISSVSSSVAYWTVPFDVIIEVEKDETISIEVNNLDSNDTILAGEASTFLQISLPDGAVSGMRGASAAGSVTELNDLTDVNTSTPTNKNVLVADGVDWESRALLITDVTSFTLAQLNTALSDATLAAGTVRRIEINSASHDNYPELTVSTTTITLTTAYIAASCAIYVNGALFSDFVEATSTTLTTGSDVSSNEIIVIYESAS